MAPVRRVGGLARAFAVLAVAGPASVRASPAPALAPGECRERCATLELVVRVAGSRVPIEGATIYVLPAPPEAEVGVLRKAPEPAPSSWQRVDKSDVGGGVRITELPAGLVHVAVIAEGVGRHDEIVDLQPDADLVRRIFVRPAEELAYRTTVQAPPIERADATSQVLTIEEIRTVPGTQGDPLRALQDLPGVARAPASLGLLVIRGAPPGQSRVFLGGHALPRAFHVLSLASVFPADILESLRFVPGNFDPAYGNATGGIVVIEPRPGVSRGVHGHAELDLAAASALVEGRVGRGSFVVAAQRGYVDAVLATASAVSERVTGQRERFLLPAYYDYQGMLDYPLRGRASIGVRLFGAGDRIHSDRSDGTLPGAEFEFRSDFHRADVTFRTRGPARRFFLTPSFRYELARSLSSSTLAGRERVRRDFIVSLRSELERRVSSRFSLVVGTDFEIDAYGGYEEITETLDGTRDSDRTRARGTETSLGTYASADVHLGRVHLRPGARVSAFSADRQTAYSIDPRFTMHVDVNEAWRLHFAVGRYSQARSVRDTEVIDLVSQGVSVADGSLFLPAVFSRFDPEISFAPAPRQLTVRQAWHASTGARYEFGDGYAVETTAFLREQDDATPVFFDNAVVGYNTGTRTYGLELLARKRLTKRLYGWLAYTLMRSEMRQYESGPLVVRPSDFDQRHNFIALASYSFPKRWRVGARFRVVTGYPFTPVLGSVVLDGGSRAVILGPRNADRLGPFHQLDLRVDKEWLLRRVRVFFYVDVQNVYNRVNPEAAIYSADYRSQVDVVGIPIFPSFGLRVEF